MKYWSWSYPTEGETLEQQKLLLNLIQQYLGNYLWPQSNGFKTINEMISSGKNLLMTLEFAEIPNTIWPSYTILNSYANSPDLSTMENYNLQKLKEWSQHGIYQNQLFKMSWTLTPTVTTILEMVLPGKPHTLIELADIADPDLGNYYTNQVQPQHYQYPIFGNILIIDDFASSPIVNIVQQGMNEPQ